MAAPAVGAPAAGGGGGGGGVTIEQLVVSAYRIPTDAPNESDGTLVWNETTLVLV